MEQIENRMVLDSQWELVELLQMRVPDVRSRRVQRILDEMEYNNIREREVVREDEFVRD